MVIQASLQEKERIKVIEDEKKAYEDIEKV
jgi:hypothetical protein